MDWQYWKYMFLPLPLAPCNTRRMTVYACDYWTGAPTDFEYWE